MSGLKIQDAANMRRAMTDLSSQVMLRIGSEEKAMHLKSNSLTVLPAIEALGNCNAARVIKAVQSVCPTMG